MNTRDYLDGKSQDGFEFFGSHKRKSKDYIFRVLAPNAKNVYIAGDFNNWEKSSLRKYQTGVFSITFNQVNEGDRYEYLIEDVEGNFYKKLDPYSKKICLEEGLTVIDNSAYKFKYKKISQKPKNIYQVHLGSLFRDKEDKKKVYEKLVNHIKDNNFTHVQIMPVSEYKNYKQMGYSSLGLFAFSERYGSLDDFKYFIDILHKNKLGIIVELDIAEFDPDFLGLDKFDGTNLYNYDYDNIKYNYYGSINFDPGKNFVKSYLLSLVNYYVKELRIDGIYFSSAENMIYWQGDKNRGVNNSWLELIREINDLIRQNKSYSIAGINGVYEEFDLGFDLIFDSEFINIVEVFQRQPIERAIYQTYIRKLIQNGNSKKVLGFSYVDSYLNEANLAMKMFSDDKKISQLKTLFTFLMTLKSSKFIFMGDELADMRTFSIYNNFDVSEIINKSFNQYYKDLAKIFLNTKALCEDESSIKILDVDGYSIYAYERTYKNEKYLVVVNFTDIGYEINSPYNLEEIINTNNLKYEGTGNVNGKIIIGEEIRIEPFGSAIFKIK
ncbi:alpha amylase, catalytic domain protein [Anaerococcus lactolyticus ATCC 51172]|uniref:1,4-alpha-glucan branching enzyme n=1 Tax=Anaerococcus lactolyticus ATCC 51172 TaxID=525254 RepID=C2BD39_9FIRM|nr:alpha amylase C-terminal domain-containing protein [Anaerococcus lactolyticus]EEI87231.1 alpha amylase, catalytic domain protein [Anaerococcus lactolyticus ATCC 51172]